MSHYVFIEGGIAGLTEANALANVGSVILLEQSRTLGGHASELGISASRHPMKSYLHEFSRQTPSLIWTMKFGLKGGLAASLCYIVYNAIA